MNLLIYSVFSISLAMLPTRGSRSISSRPQRSPVIGGRDAKIIEFPFFVTLELGSGYQLCGGAIVSRHFVVTAAHCFKLSNNPDDYVIRSGSNIKGVGGTEHFIASVDKHPNYTSDATCTPSNDIAVVGMKEPFKLDKYREDTIPLVQAGDEVKHGMEAIIIGVGYTENGPTDHLKSAVMLITEKKNCTEALSKINPTPIPESVICAGVGEDKRDACFHDSGSPLVVGNRLAGITSFGTSCGTVGIPGLYTDVSQFQRWIVKTIKLRRMFQVHSAEGEF